MPVRGAISDLPLFAHAAMPAAVRERDITAGRHRNAPTSVLAQQARASSAAEQRAQVLQAIREAGPAGLTVDELSARWNRPPNQLSGRCSELKAEGHLQEAGRRRT